MTRHILACDGSYRVYVPRISGGAFLVRENPPQLIGTAVHRLDRFGTSVESEWHALALGLQLARHYGVPELLVAMDCENVVLQMQGKARIRANIEALWCECDELVKRFERVEFLCVNRRSFAARASHALAWHGHRPAKRARVEQWIEAVLRKGVRLFKSMTKKDWRNLDLRAGGMPWADQP